MVILPGGGYGALAPHEGKGYADWLVTNGIALLCCQIPLGHAWLPASAHARRRGGARCALVRSRATNGKLTLRALGLMGSSAGGHLASTLLTHFDVGKADASDPIERQNSRPDLGILCYPVITMMGPNAHGGSKTNLLGKDPDPELVKLLSNELQVTKQTRRVSFGTPGKTRAVKMENSLEFAAALRRAEVPFDLHVYQKARMDWPRGQSSLGARLQFFGSKHRGL